MVHHLPFSSLLLPLLLLPPPLPSFLLPPPSCSSQLSFAPSREKLYRLNLPIKVKALAGPAPDFRDAGQIGE